jgi:hypothetical protein
MPKLEGNLNNPIFIKEYYDNLRRYYIQDKKVGFNVEDCLDNIETYQNIKDREYLNSLTKFEQIYFCEYVKLLGSERKAKSWKLRLKLEPVFKPQIFEDEGDDFF